MPKHCPSVSQISVFSLFILLSDDFIAQPPIVLERCSIELHHGFQSLPVDFLVEMQKPFFRFKQDYHWINAGLHLAYGKEGIVTALFPNIGSSANAVMFISQ